MASTSGGNPETVDLGGWRIVSPGTTAPPRADVYVLDGGYLRWPGLADPRPGEAAVDTLRRYLAERGS